MMAYPSSRWPPARILASALLIPCSFVAVDYLLIDWVAAAWNTDSAMLVTMSAFVVQIGVMGIVCGRMSDWPLLRWVLYCWCWVLIDFQTVIAWIFADIQWWWRDSFQAAALFAAQLGMALIWAILGPGRWTIRVPLSAVPAAALLLALIRFRYSYERTAFLFAIELVVLAALCGRLRWRGYRLIRSSSLVAANGPPMCVRTLPPSQFELRDMILWTSAFGLVCGVVRVVGIPLESWVYMPKMLPALFMMFCGCSVAVALALVLAIALGPDQPRVRWSIPVVALPLIGAVTGLVEWLLWMTESGQWTAAWHRGKPWSVWLRWCWGSYYYGEGRLISWMCLAGAMLFAALLFPRALGYRLLQHDEHSQEPNPAT